MCDLTQECSRVDSRSPEIGSKLPQALKHSKGGMVAIDGVDCHMLWDRLRAWLADKDTLQMVGGPQKAVASGVADFQLLRMHHGVPTPQEKQTLETFLRHDFSGKHAVAAVGLPGWDRHVLRDKTRHKSRCCVTDGDCWVLCD